MNQIADPRLARIRHPIEHLRTLYASPFGEAAVFPTSRTEALVTRIWIERQHRRKGNGSALLDYLCAEADRYGVALIVTPSPTDAPSYGLEEPHLGNWYARHGFADDGPERMRREPR